MKSEYYVLKSHNKYWNGWHLTSIKDAKQFKEKLDAENYISEHSFEINKIEFNIVKVRFVIEEID